MPSLLRLMKRAQSSFVGLSLISKYYKFYSLQLDIGKIFEIHQRVACKKRLRRKCLWQNLMDTYLNSLDRVALYIELRLQNDLEQALDLDEVEPTG